MLKKLRIWQKITLIAVSCSVPMFVLLYFLIGKYAEGIEFAQAEQRGVDYLKPLHTLVLRTGEHRDLLSAAASGDAVSRAKLEAKAAEVETAWKAVDEAQAEVADEFDPRDNINRTRALWQEIRAKAANLPPEESFTLHTRLLTYLYDLSYNIGNSFNLILDAEIRSHYTMDAIVYRIPRLTEEIGQLRATAAMFIASGTEGDDNSRRKGRIAELLVRAQDSLRETRDAIRFAKNEHPEIERTLGPLLVDLEGDTRTFLQAVSDKVVNRELTGQALPTTEQILAQAGQVLTRASALWDATATDLVEFLERRVTFYNEQRLTAFLAAALALVITICLIVLVVRAITRPIAYLTHVADRISLGEMDVQIQVESQDEIGELAERFRRMQTSLKAAMDALEGADSNTTQY